MFWEEDLIITEESNAKGKFKEIGPYYSFFYFDCQKYLCKIEVSNSKS
jgi:hypothetical protein